MGVRARTMRWRLPVTTVGLLGTILLVGCGTQRHDGAVRLSLGGCVVGRNTGPGERTPSAPELLKQCLRSQPVAGAQPPAAPRDDDAAQRGRHLIVSAGCTACHQLGRAGRSGPGPPLTRVGDRLPRAAILRALRQPVAPMPSYRLLGAARLRALAAYLTGLRGPS